ncbi:MAG: glycosyltransferase, partial [Bdellovibrionales bacterium]|nr:glycosyltransferase [Bdellovibrionales bacterium]
METSPVIPIVVRTKNNDDILAQTLEGIYSQKDVAFEVIILDSGSTDKTLEI